MKRASLSALPVTPAAEPADLTDRLLGTEAPAAKAKATPPAAPPTLSPTPAPSQPAPESAPPAAESPAAESPAATSTLEAALQQAHAAADALRQAGREAPARYDVALRYRLDALAHHLRQVAEFMASVARR